MNLHLIVDYMPLCNMVERMIQWKDLGARCMVKVGNGV
jgi:hypothetical protein